ncbi:HAD family hydrolase [Prescottella agglutinans]|uniref:HAD superfamily hydrolase (TIGR01509 family) n=1 Tax=Prescottella agglutinans TaxID=1644129 RepID=A0ABT6MK21_9NOCA|nr:HAD family phosphatase [Prescottella agglutinans]MDH6284255.1 HAD superfamily hydrolase (TIGR01509 family) [Prescottella agglutinans]
MAIPSKVGAVVFDCDGLLLDTETCWSRAEASLFADHGYGFGPAEKDILIGRTLEAACANMAEYIGRPGYGPELETQLLPRVEAELSTRVEAMPGARELLELLDGRVPLAVASNSPRALLSAALASAGLDGFFKVSLAADEVDNPKPHPELYLRAFEELSSSPSEGVALEDSATGIAAARAAGTFLVTVPSQPGKILDGDYLTDSLEDPAIVSWAHRVRAVGRA